MPCHSERSEESRFEFFRISYLHRQGEILRSAQDDSEERRTTVPVISFTPSEHGDAKNYLTNCA
jgi:hypothetical protein